MGQMLLTMGLQREKAGRASMAMYLSVSARCPSYSLAFTDLLQLFFSLIFEFIIFHTIPPILSILGAAIIIASAVWVAVSPLNRNCPPRSGSASSPRVWR